MPSYRGSKASASSPGRSLPTGPARPGRTRTGARGRCPGAAASPRGRLRGADGADRPPAATDWDEGAAPDDRLPAQMRTGHRRTGQLRRLHRARRGARSSAPVRTRTPPLPAGLDYAGLAGLSTEVRQHLARAGRTPSARQPASRASRRRRCRSCWCICGGTARASPEAPGRKTGAAPIASQRQGANIGQRLRSGSPCQRGAARQEQGQHLQRRSGRAGARSHSTDGGAFRGRAAGHAAARN